jgi:hypothetical protein
MFSMRKANIVIIILLVLMFVLLGILWRQRSSSEQISNEKNINLLSQLPSEADLEAKQELNKEGEGSIFIKSSLKIDQEGQQTNQTTGEEISAVVLQVELSPVSEAGIKAVTLDRSKQSTLLPRIWSTDLKGDLLLSDWVCASADSLDMALYCGGTTSLLKGEQGLIYYYIRKQDLSLESLPKTLLLDVELTNGKTVPVEVQTSLTPIF